MDKPKPLDPVHPGEILLEEFLKPLGMSAYAAAKVMGVPRTRVERLMRHEASITPDTALRLERAFGSSAEMWMGLQADYDLEVARLAHDVSLDAIRRVIAAE
jgi:addiction module HigA family antidote